MLGYAALQGLRDFIFLQGSLSARPILNFEAITKVYNKEIEKLSNTCIINSEGL